MAETNHNELALRAAQDESSFNQLYNAYIDQIYGFVGKRVGHRETCEDIVSEIFRKVFLHLNSFDPNKASFRTWMYRIATNTITDFWRVHRNPNKPATVQLEEIHDLRDERENPARYVLAEEQRVWIQSCVNQLPPQYQKIVQLKFFEEFDNQEIAEILQIKPNHVGVLAHRAQQKLKKILENSQKIET